MSGGRPGGFESGNVADFGRGLADGFDMFNARGPSRHSSLVNAPYGGEIFSAAADSDDDERHSSSFTDSELSDSASPSPARRSSRRRSPSPRRRRKTRDNGTTRRRPRRSRRRHGSPDAYEHDEDDFVEGDVAAPPSPERSLSPAKKSKKKRRHRKKDGRGGDSDPHPLSGIGNGYKRDWRLPKWYPPEWNPDILGQAHFDMSWRGSLKDFAAGRTTDDRQRRIDRTLCLVENDEFNEHCRRNGKLEYSACSAEMFDVYEHRLNDRTVHPMLLNVKNAYNNLPFPVCIVCENNSAMNTVRTTVLNSSGTAERRNVMMILPANSRIDDQRVADFRRLMTDEGIVTYMNLDKTRMENDMEEKLGNRHGERLGRIRADTKYYEIVEALCDLPDHEMYHVANDIRAAAMKHRNKLRNVKSRSTTAATNVGMWYEDIPLKPFQEFKAWISDQIDKVIKLDSLCLRIVPKYGPKAWLNPSLWSVPEVLETRYLAQLCKEFLDNRPIETDRPEFRVPTNVGFILDIRFL